MGLLVFFRVLSPKNEIFLTIESYPLGGRIYAPQRLGNSLSKMYKKIIEQYKHYNSNLLRWCPLLGRKQQTYVPIRIFAFRHSFFPFSLRQTATYLVLLCVLDTKVFYPFSVICVAYNRAEESGLLSRPFPHIEKKNIRKHFFYKKNVLHLCHTKKQCQLTNKKDKYIQC